jgi:hypothetical protein
MCANGSRWSSHCGIADNVSGRYVAIDPTSTAHRDQRPLRLELLWALANSVLAIIFPVS